MKIVAAHDGGSGCCWYRMYVPLKAAAQYSDDVSVDFFVVSMDFPGGTDDPFLTKPEQVDGADVFVAQRVNSYDNLGMWRRLYTHQRKLVYENDDDIWNITRENPAYKMFEDGTLVREAVKRYCDTSSLITVTTPYLGDRHREMSPGTPVEVLPNYIPEWVLDLAHDDRQGHPRLGWLGGSSHLRDLQVPGDSVRRFARRFPDWHIYVNGVDFRKEVKVPKDQAFHVRWIPVCTQPKLYYRTIDFDIGIAPLLDTEFSRSKSPIKALEYAARGIPIVASDVGPYRDFVKHGETGFLVKPTEPHNWLKYLTELANDEELRLKMGKAAQEQAREHTIEKHWPKWISAYKMLFPVGWEYQG